VSEHTIQQAIAVVLREIHGAFAHSKQNEDTPRTWYELLKDLDPGDVFTAWRAYARRDEQYPPSPGQIRVLVMRAKGGDSLSLTAGEALRRISFRADGQRNLPTQVAIDCGAAEPGPHDTWAMPSDGPARAIAERRFTQAWDSIRSDPDQMATLALSAAARNEAICAGELPPGHREENERLARGGLASLGLEGLGA
jgi:hypothetical protein